MADYTKILPHVSKWEGGLVYFPTEGQYTNRGVQWTTFERLAPRLIGLTNPTVDDLKNMTESQWRAFVKYFWDKATYNNSINAQDSANLMFHALWGSGAYGIKDMQKALNVSADGVVGPQTVAAVNNTPNAAEKLYTALENRYRRLAAQAPDKYAQFVKGWINRLKDLNTGLVISVPLMLIGLYLFYHSLK